MLTRKPDPSSDQWTHIYNFFNLASGHYRKQLKEMQAQNVPTLAIVENLVINKNVVKSGYNYSSIGESPKWFCKSGLMDRCTLHEYKHTTCIPLNGVF